MEAIYNLVCKELYQEPRPLREVKGIGEESFTTGDEVVDNVLGGGIRTGMVWELCGEK